MTQHSTAEHSKAQHDTWLSQLLQNLAGHLDQHTTALYSYLVLLS